MNEEENTKMMCPYTRSPCMGKPCVLYDKKNDDCLQKLSTKNQFPTRKNTEETRDSIDQLHQTQIQILRYLKKVQKELEDQDTEQSDLDTTEPDLKYHLTSSNTDPFTYELDMDQTQTQSKQDQDTLKGDSTTNQSTLKRKEMPDLEYMEGRKVPKGKVTLTNSDRSNHIIIPQWAGKIIDQEIGEDTEKYCHYQMFQRFKGLVVYIDFYSEKEMREIKRNWSDYTFYKVVGHGTSKEIPVRGFFKDHNIDLDRFNFPVRLDAELPGPRTMQVFLNE